MLALAAPQPETIAPEPEDIVVESDAVSTPAPDQADKYRFIAENGNQVLCFLHPEHGCAYVSANWERITGHDAEHSLGQGFFDVIIEGGEEIRASMARMSEAMPSLSVQIRHADGTPHWYDLCLCPPAPAQAYEGFIPCLLQNVHDQKLTHDSLRKAREALEIAMRARSEFLAGMNHELRTPLNAIIGFTEMMRHELFGTVDSPQHRDYLRCIQDSGYELLAKIEDLLALARIEHNDNRLQAETFDLIEPVQKAVSANTYLAFSSHITLESYITESLRIRADKMRLQHAFSNLIACAIRASLPHRRVMLGYKIEEYGALTLGVHCEVENPVAFATQASVARQRTQSASLSHGPDPLRLAIARDIAQMHGGSVSVRATEGQGVEFLMRLPARVIARQEPARILEFASQA